LNEVDFWENLLKWCFAQQNMVNDPTNGVEEILQNIKRLLHRSQTFFTTTIKSENNKSVDAIINDLNTLIRDRIHQDSTFGFQKDSKYSMGLLVSFVFKIYLFIFLFLINLFLYFIENAVEKFTLVSEAVNYYQQLTPKEPISIKA
jgi:hypothetical protein